MSQTFGRSTYAVALALSLGCSGGAGTEEEDPSKADSGSAAGGASPDGGAGAPGAGSGGAAGGAAGAPVTAGAAGEAGTGPTTDAGSGGTAGGGGGSSGDAAAGAAGAPPTSAGDCPGKLGAPGLAPRTVTVGTATRKFIVQVPTTADPTKALPIVFAHHGKSMDGEGMRKLTALDALAEAEGFVAVFPDGIDTTWSTGGATCGLGVLTAGGADDFAFVEAMLASIEADQCLDRKRVFVTGFSMGGFFSNHIACHRPDLVRAVSPAAGGNAPPGCVAGPKPILLMHGTTDIINATDCGFQARDYWITHNHCSTDFDNLPIQGGHCEWYKGCDEGGQVALCLLEGLGHEWVGPTSTVFADEGKIAWQFFKDL